MQFRALGGAKRAILRSKIEDFAPEIAPMEAFLAEREVKGRSGSENGEFLRKSANVQQTLCFASPNGSPQEPKFEILAGIF